ncbi:MAG: hypothetical protein JSW63_01040 [Ignavibacterium sp.]|nr:MAG: hypothetical protein JSW63_01040 [Ignavibacterium sp.]
MQTPGAWNFLFPLIKNDVQGDLEISYVEKPQSASPAVGSFKISMQQQRELIRKAFEKIIKI